MKNTVSPSFVDAIPKWVILAITLPFTVLTIYALSQFGIMGIFQQGLHNSATTQILIDLVICAFFFIAWLKEDAKKTNRNFYFWALVTIAIGSFGPLLYLLTRKKPLSQ